MYNRTDKIGHFNKLRMPSAAQKDLILLKKRNPSLPRLARYGRNPERYADDILYDLLDCCTAEEINANRGEKKTATATKPNSSKPAVKSNPTRGNGTKKTGNGTKQAPKKSNGTAKNAKAVNPEPVSAEQEPTLPEPESVATEPKPSEAAVVDSDKGEDAKKK